VTEPLRNYNNWRKSIRNFEWLQETVSGAMDIDMLVERNGHFLIVEGKPWHFDGGVVVPWGQHRALMQLSMQPNTVVFLVGEAEDEVYILNYAEAGKPRYWRGSSSAYWPEERFDRTTKGAIRKMIQDWWEVASG